MDGMIFVITLDILEYKDESTKLYRLNDCDIVVIIRLLRYQPAVQHLQNQLLNQRKIPMRKRLFQKDILNPLLLTAVM